MRKKSTILAILLLAVVTLGLWTLKTSRVPTLDPGRPPSLVLVTLDTTRSDYLSAYGAAAPQTPTLDALANRGTRFTRALTASPLTLPAHASLFTGLEPPVHGLLDNGTATLDPAVPTLAGVLRTKGYATGAFVSSRVLDRRFGLDSGFDTYDDFMPAEQIGEYGYPERNAEAVTSAAISWSGLLTPSKPFFLWVHYYDPHAPYDPPVQWQGSTPEAAYAGEIAFMDQQIGRLLTSLRESEPNPLIAVVGDHGESLGEHGERTHGVFLYRAVLEVPLILAGPGVPGGATRDEVVASRRVAATLLGLVGDLEAARSFGSRLPGFPSLGEDPAPEPVYSTTWMPAHAYGWSPLTALSNQKWRFIRAPRPEFFEFRQDPEEHHNLIEESPEEARKLERDLVALEQSWESLPSAPSRKTVEPELLAALRSLGYVSGASSPGQGEEPAGQIDPKDGIHLLADFERARQLVPTGQFGKAIAILEDLVLQNPRNIPFLSQLAKAQLDSGDGDTALDTYRKTIRLNPDLDFLRLNFADALRKLQHMEEARKEYETVLELNPRSASAWLALAEMAMQSGAVDEERRLLLRALEKGTASAMIHCRLGQIESRAGNLAASDIHFLAATELARGWALPWILWGSESEAQGQFESAIIRHTQAVSIDPANPAAHLRLGRLYLSAGEPLKARSHLQEVVTLAPDSPEAQEARSLLR